MFGAILKATNSSFQKGMTFCRSIYVKKVMKLLAFIFEQPSYKNYTAAYLFITSFFVFINCLVVCHKIFIFGILVIIGVSTNEFLPIVCQWLQFNDTNMEDSVGTWKLSSRRTSTCFCTVLTACCYETFKI